MIVLTLSQEQPREGELSPGWGEQGSVGVPCTARPCCRAGQEKLLNLFGSSSSFSPLCVCGDGGSSSLLGYTALGGQSRVLVVFPALQGIQDVTCLRP